MIYLAPDLAAVDLVTPLAIYGPLGIFVGAFMMGLVYSKHVVDRLIKERDRAEDRAAEMLKDYKAVVPLLERAVDAIRVADTKAATSEALSGELRSALNENTAILQRVIGYMDRR